MKRDRIIIILTFLATLLGAVLVFRVPVPASWKLSALDFYLPFVGNVTMAGLHIGAAILFAANLGVYKAQLKRAYIAIAAGISCIAIGTLQVSIVNATDTQTAPWIQAGGAVIPFLVSSMTLYLAARYLVRVVDIHHVLSKSWLVLPGILIVSALSSLLPHVATTLPETAYDLAVGSIVWTGGLTLAATILIVAVQLHVGTHYRQAMTWLAYAFFVSFIIIAVQFIYTLTSTNPSDILARFSTLLAVLSGVLWLLAGYAFARTRDY